MRKPKPPRGHPDRKPRHAGNPRRVPDMFRVTNWRRMVDLVDHHHDYLDWKKLMGFLGRTATFYKLLPRAQKEELRNSGLMERYPPPPGGPPIFPRPLSLGGGGLPMQTTVARIRIYRCFQKVLHCVKTKKLQNAGRLGKSASPPPLPHGHPTRSPRHAR